MVRNEISRLDLLERKVWDLQQCREQWATLRFYVKPIGLFSYLCSVIQFSAWVIMLTLHHIWTHRQEEETNKSITCLPKANI